MKKTVERSRDGLAWYADNDLWFIFPALFVVIAYMIWRHG